MLNSVTIHVLRKNSLLPKPLKTLLLSLAVSDLGAGLIVQPLYIVVTVMKLEHSQFYSTTYIVFLTTANIFGFASFFGVMALSVDRFLAVHLHLRYQELVTPKRVVAVVISMWVFCAVISFVRLWIGPHISYVIFAIIGASLLLTTTPLNYKIYVTVRHHANHIQALQVQQETQDGGIGNNAGARKFAIGTVFVYLAFMVCYLPTLCYLLVFAISGPSTTIKVFYPYSLTMIFLNSSLNPLIYCWKLRHIRHAVMNILRNIWRNHNINEIQPAN